VGIFSFDKPSLLIRDLELVKNILVKDFQTFMNRVFSLEEKLDPVLGNNLAAVRGQLWRHLRTSLTTVFTSRKMKMMFYLVDTCGKELIDCLEKITADGKLSKNQYGYKVHCKIKVQKLEEYKGFIHSVFQELRKLLVLWDIIPETVLSKKSLHTWVQLATVQVL
jgi:hypothetical protein